MILGIDLGTTNSLVGVMDSGFPILIADRDGSRLTPSVVQVADDGTLIAGAAAARQAAMNPHRTIRSVKRWMGIRRGEHPEDEAALPYAIEAQQGEPVAFRFGELILTPEEISAAILRKLKADAERAMEREATSAVITVPAYFNNAQRNATKRAGELAGLEVARIVNEPTAAALAYGLNRLKDRSRIAVYDFGGGTFDLSILELNEGVHEVLATHGDTRLGGDDIDAALVQWFLRHCDVREPSDQLLGRIRDACVSAKHQISDAEIVKIEVPFAETSRSLDAELKRVDFERLIVQFIDITLKKCQRALADARLSVSDVNAVLLVGGSTRISLVQSRVADFFMREVNISQHPDEAVALGATIQAGILSGAVQSMTLLDVTPLSLGIETFGGLMNVLIPRNSTIPTKAGEMFTNAVDGQRAVQINVLQGEREMARDNWKLGTFDLDFQPVGKGKARVGVQFKIDADGILEVLARDTSTGTEQIVHLNSVVDVDDADVEKMVSESVEHALDDMSERALTEARMKAENMLQSLDQALKLAGDALSAEDAAEIQQNSQALSNALESGVLADVKRTMATLDSSTEHLAALVVERAMEDALRAKGVL